MAPRKRKTAAASAPPADQAADTDTVPIAASKAPVVVPIWDSGSVKNTLDDTFRTAVLAQSEGFEASFSEEDFKLWVAGLACLIAGGACVYGFFVPHPESSPVVGVCAGAYFLFMLFLNVYAMFFDSHLMLLAKRSGESGTSVLKLATHMERFSPLYKVQLSIVSPSGESLDSTSTFNVGNFFYEDGELSEANVTDAAKALVAEALATKTKSS